MILDAVCVCPLDHRVERDFLLDEVLPFTYQRITERRQPIADGLRSFAVPRTRAALACF